MTTFTITGGSGPDSETVKFYLYVARDDQPQPMARKDYNSGLTEIHQFHEIVKFFYPRSRDHGCSVRAKAASNSFDVYPGETLRSPWRYGDNKGLFLSGSRCWPYYPWSPKWEIKCDIQLCAFMWTCG